VFLFIQSLFIATEALISENHKLLQKS